MGHRSGGHRRIPLADAIRFIRDRRLVLERPEILGLGELSAAATLPQLVEMERRWQDSGIPGLYEGVGPEMRERAREASDPSVSGPDPEWVSQSRWITGQAERWHEGDRIVRFVRYDGFSGCRRRCGMAARSSRTQVRQGPCHPTCLRSDTPTGGQGRDRKSVV